VTWDQKGFKAKEVFQVTEDIQVKLDRRAMMEGWVHADTKVSLETEDLKVNLDLKVNKGRRGETDLQVLAERKARGV